ncbi:MAG: hypothetical protein N3D11_13600 [Candidatus Sumerlaeia bacterium]|nr:hypothetical protein [Candidatus Sumerlaeia bacterium]
MEQAGSQTHSKPAEAIAWMRRNGKTLLLGVDVLLLLAFVFLVASWMVFKARSASLLTMAEQIQSGARENTPSGDRRGAATPSTASATGKSSERTAPRGKTSGGDGEDVGRTEQLVRLERRALFGEPRPSVHVPQVEAIFGNAAMLDGRWVERGGKAGEFTLVDLKPDRVVVADAEGDTRSLVMTGPVQGLAMVRAPEPGKMSSRGGGGGNFRSGGKLNLPDNPQRGPKGQSSGAGAAAKQSNKDEKIFRKLAQMIEGGSNAEKKPVKKMSADENRPDSGPSMNAGGKKMKESSSDNSSGGGNKNSRGAGRPSPPKKGKSKKFKSRG